jgi:prolyl-tRNA synthetase
MKDAYSFNEDYESLDKEYKNMGEAYKKIFDRLGLKYRIVSAFSGAMGGSQSDEFIALSDVGESEIAYCSSCDYSATRERAEINYSKGSDNLQEEILPLKKVETVNIKTIEDLAKFLNLKKEKTMKALILKDDINDKIVLAFIRGDKELNMSKLSSVLKIPEHALAFLGEDKISLPGVIPGFTGPVNIKKGTDILTIIDSELKTLKNLSTGAGEKNYHLINVNYGRDYTVDLIADIVLAKDGDSCPICGEKLILRSGIEIGQMFKLGDNYSKA